MFRDPPIIAPIGARRQASSPSAYEDTVTFVGNPLFHLPEDRWPHAVDIDVVTRLAAAAAALVVKLTG